MSLPLRENLLELYYQHLSTRRKRYLDPENTQRVPNTPAKRQKYADQEATGSGESGEHSHILDDATFNHQQASSSNDDCRSFNKEISNRSQRSSRRSRGNKQFEVEEASNNFDDNREVSERVHHGADVNKGDGHSNSTECSQSDESHETGDNNSHDSEEEVIGSDHRGDRLTNTADGSFSDKESVITDSNESSRSEEELTGSDCRRDRHPNTSDGSMSDFVQDETEDHESPLSEEESPRTDQRNDLSTAEASSDEESDRTSGSESHQSIEGEMTYQVDSANSDNEDQINFDPANDNQDENNFDCADDNSDNQDENNFDRAGDNNDNQDENNFDRADDNSDNQDENNFDRAGDINDNQDGDNLDHADNNNDNQDENNIPPAGNNRQQRKQSLEDLINGPYAEPVNAGVEVTRSDLLYMVLGLAEQNHFTNKAFTDSVQLINSIFHEPVLPVSSARLDSILVDSTGVKYYFYCSNCFKSFGELNYKNRKTKNCENCGTVNPISDLRIASYFCMFDLTHALENILNKPGIKEALLKPSDAVKIGKDGHISDIYDGSEYKEFARRVSNFNELVVSFHFCTDGAPLFKSSKNSIWPIMFCMNKLPPKLRMQNILLGGLWFGKKQPPMNLLLQPLSEQAARLSNGFVIQVQNEPVDVRAFITGCCVDSGARGKVQGIKSHGGYFACNWCFIHGEYIDNAVKYPMRAEVPRKRTHEEMLQLMRRLGNFEEQLSDDEEPPEELLGVQDVSPLINVPMFNMVSGFFVEGMHCLGLGVTKAHLLKWLDDNGDYNISDSATLIDERLASLKPPLEFRRMPRKLLEKARYKARELDNFLSYVIIPVLTGILPQKYLKLWLLLAQAVYLLSLTSVSHSHVNTANALLKHFIFVSQQYYGATFMVYNMHILNHLAEHVARWGPLWAASAYCFENYNGYLLKIIRSQQGVPHQVIRAVSWQQSLRTLEPLVSEKARQYVKSLPTKKKEGIEMDGCVLLGRSSLFNATEEERWFCERLECNIMLCEEYSKIIKNKCVFTKQLQGTTNNSVAQLTDKRIVQIKKIMLDRPNEKVYLFVYIVHTESIINLPPGVQLDISDQCMLKVTHVGEELHCFPCSELNTICFLAEFQHGTYVAPLPNVFNIF
ncbi:Halomucin [Frankliniella fusca]|uniref:Halomucin n=1 Tax=Frankliniella fusca TaxID=407009 RepID=A0AAE1GXZ0_9NEOP|nr:Halomucin [Frankliniella fusca]